MQPIALKNDQSAASWVRGRETDSEPNINLCESSSQFSRGQESRPLCASKEELMKPEVTALCERLGVGSINVT